jgi:Na+/H+ antiporter NhaC
VSGKRGAELSIAALVSVVNVCTANNTVAILTVGDISKSIGDRFGLDNRKCASILDTFSCCVQGLLPYGAQVLMGAGLSQLNPIEIIPNLYYPMVLGVVALLAILLRYPRSFS